MSQLRILGQETPRNPVVISYSGGGSSEWLVEAVLRGVIPRPEALAVIFADTGAEHQWTYEAVDRVEARCRAGGVEFLRCSRDESLTEHLLTIGERHRADHPPFWIAKAGGGRGRAQHRCTREFKIAPMRRAVSKWLRSNGYPKRVTKWIGFASDEGHRAQAAAQRQDVQWESMEFPLVRLGFTRARQRAQLIEWTGSAPGFSMCVFCPFKSPARWRATPPRDLEVAVAVDEAIRDLDCVGLTDGPAYLSDRLIPVSDLIKGGDPQPMLPGMESYCASGACFL